MDLGISGRLALVAGASQGIGRATALGLAREGADVALFARSADKLEAVAGEIRALGRRALPVVVDLTDRAALRAAVERSRVELGPPTILVLAAAAVYEAQKLQFVEAAEVDRLLATDLTSSVDLCRALLPEMMAARHGRIVAISSVAAGTGVPGGALYATGKAALEGLMRGIALDDSRRGITANAVRVGFADTERLAGRTAGSEEARARLARFSSVRRLLSPEEIADAIVFLCSARASAITGAVVDVTGGAHLNNLW